MNRSVGELFKGQNLLQTVLSSCPQKSHGMEGVVEVMTMTYQQSQTGTGT